MNRAQPSRVKQWLRRLRTLLWTALALTIIGLAVLVGVGKLLMPYSERFKPRLEAVLAEQFNQPVRLDAFTGEWKAFGPRISLEGVNLLGGPDGEGALAIQRAALDIKPLNALIADRPLYSFRIIGADLTLVRTADGRLELSGLGLSGRRVDEPAQNRGSGLGNLARVGEIRLQDSRFSFRDVAQDLQFQLDGIDGRLQLRGEVLALEVQASLNDTRRGLVLGDLAATAQARLDGNALQDLEFHLETGELMLDELALDLPDHPLKPVSGRVNAQLWGAWAPGLPLRIDGVADLRDAGLDTGREQLFLDRLNARVNWRWNNKTQWRLDLADVRVAENGRDWVAPRIAVERNLEGGIAAWVGTDSIQAEFPLQAVQVFMRELGYNWPRVAPTAGRGLVTDFDLVINANRKLAAASGEFENLEVLGWGDWPLARGLSGRIDLAFGEGSVFLGGEDVTIRWPRNFREPLVADLEDCEVEILWDESNHYQIDALPCPVVSEVIEGRARLRFVKSEGKPWVDINVAVDRADLASLAPYWPASAIKPRVLEWIDRSILAGSAENARFVLRGDMDDFPFRSNEGTLRAEVPVRGATLDYTDNWPRAEGIAAQLRVDGAAMSIRGSIGRIGGAAVGQAEARIPDLQAPVLALDYLSETDLPALRSFIEATPLLDNSELELDNFLLEGNGTIRGALSLPLGDSPGEPALAGTLTVSDGTFEERESAFRLETVAGEIRYTQEGIDGDELSTTFDGWPATLGFNAAWGAERPFDARLAGRFPLSLLLARTPLAEGPLLDRFQGTADWTASFSVVPEGDGEPSALWLDIESNLDEVSLDLPEPLAKPAGEAWPLALRFPLRAREPVISARIGDRVAVLQENDPDAPQRAVRGAIQLGAGSPALPAVGRYTLSGTTEALDLDGWVDLVVDLARADATLGSLSLSASDVRVGSVMLLNRRFDNVTLGLATEDGVLTGRFDSEALAGDLRYQRNPSGTHSLSAQLDRLWLADAEDEGANLESDPSTLPEMRFYVQDFRFMGLDLGETRLEAYPVANGLHVETLDSVSEQLNFQARGDWLVDDAGGSRSDFDIVLSSESLGNLVSALDLSSVLVGGQTLVRYDAWWPGPPTAFDLARLNGQMTFSVVDGRILNADPGAGRVLGLLSLGALPRRLALDFSDVFESGFVFDQANATVRLDSGTAYTDDFVLESTAAQLLVTGSSDLEAKAFDYTMVIKPGVSQALPVIGAIAAGPAGVAAGIALQELLREALGGAAEARYRITGPWSEPDVQRIQTNPSPTTPPEAATAQTQSTEGT
ncbi:MAG: YhdP family protein [Xanthomonadales bacterium]|jgi:uncharacterized protein (TIGR02099 family)|nr:YhdP family protein [Xanthomonadales bacterium]